MTVLWKLYQRDNDAFHDKHGPEVYAGFTAWLDGYKAGKSGHNRGT